MCDLHRPKLFAKNNSVSNYADMKYLALILAFMTTSVAAAEKTFFFDKNLTLEDLQKLEVRVELEDHATGACWTNLKEVRQYAEEKFRSKRIKTSDTEIMDTGSQKYWFIITVAAKRMFNDNNGLCLGSIDMSLVAWSYINNQVHLSVLGHYRGVPGAQPDNFNKWTLLALESVFSRFPK